MSKLSKYNGKYCESEYEYAFIASLEAEGWQYISGNNITRTTKKDVLIEDDLETFLTNSYPGLSEDEIASICDTIRLVGSESEFTTLH